MSAGVSGALSTLPLWFWRWEVEVVGGEACASATAASNRHGSAPFLLFIAPCDIFMSLSSLVPWFMGLWNDKKKIKFCDYTQTASGWKMSSTTTSVPHGHLTGNWLIWMPPSASNSSDHCCSRWAALPRVSSSVSISFLQPCWSTAYESDLSLTMIEAIRYRRRGWAAEPDAQHPPRPLHQQPNNPPLTLTSCGVQE